jgi:hypothetical protein
MKSFLIVFAFIIAIALLFLLDRKGKTEKSEMQKIYNEIFKIFNKVKWDMTIGELRETFGDKEFVTSEESDQLMGTGYMDKLGDKDIFVSFYFPKGGKDSLIRADYYLLSMPKANANSLFSKFVEIHGPPSLQNSSVEKSSSWNLGESILTLEATEENELKIQLWSKEFYNKIDNRL